MSCCGAPTDHDCAVFNALVERSCRSCRRAVRAIEPPIGTAFVLDDPLAKWTIGEPEAPPAAAPAPGVDQAPGALRQLPPLSQDRVMEAKELVDALSRSIDTSLSDVERLSKHVPWASSQIYDVKKALSAVLAPNLLSKSDRRVQACRECRTAMETMIKIVVRMRTKRTDYGGWSLSKLIEVLGDSVSPSQSSSLRNAKDIANAIVHASENSEFDIRYLGEFLSDFQTVIEMLHVEILAHSPAADMSRAQGPAVSMIELASRRPPDANQ